MIEFEILGEPVAQGRPRAGKTRRGKTVLYDPTKSRDFKQYVKLSATQYAPRKPLEGALDVEVTIYRPIPKSFSKRKTEQAEAMILRPTTKPDSSNYVKLIEDALNGVIWKDDSQIVKLVVNKYYSVKPRVKVKVREIEVEEATR